MYFAKNHNSFSIKPLYLRITKLNMSSYYCGTHTTVVDPTTRVVERIEHKQNNTRNMQESATSPFCVHCREPTRKYKCPKCSLPYCSLPCFREHRDSEVCKRKREKDERLAAEKNAEDPPEPTLYDPFTTDDTVAPQKLEELRNNEELRLLLQNPHLRKFLQEVDVAPNAWKAMRAAMQEPLFVEFADVCLKIVEPQNDEPHH